MAGLPSGTVTFLFTDIEGSTARWEHHPDTMRAALARHDAILRSAIEQHDGYVVKTMGDAFHAAFGRAPDAVAAALDAQQRLQAETWGEVGPLRVRMALHTGSAEERGGDYYGPALNRAARLMSVGHGGQVLLSQAAFELTRDALPPVVTVADLGEHRLKDLIRHEHVYQLNVPGLPSAFPPLRSLDTARHKLPIQPTPLIGREDDVKAVLGLLSSADTRLVTLTGPGGTGKTRLGLQVAAELIDQFSDGAIFVGLAPIRDPDLVAPTIGQALGVHELGSRPVLESLTAYLRDRRLLLLLDNFEQILPAGTLVATLLASCPDLKVLVTSRAPLHLRGEREFPVSPLASPPPETQMLASTVATWPSVALFVERASDVRPDFTITDETAVAVAEICRRVDGLPLALELAAARVKLLSPEALLTRLEHRLPLLTGGARDLPERQRTLRNTIDWSYELLDEAEQRLFRRLSVFVGGSALEAVEAVCDSDGTLHADVLDGVASLVDKSLARQIPGSDRDPRIAMLETIRELAGERLEASGEAEGVRRRHAEFFLEFAELARSHLRGPQGSFWLNRFEAEHDNLRAAIEWGLATSDQSRGDGTGDDEEASRIEITARIAGAADWFWRLRGHLRQGKEYVDRLLARAPAGTMAHARALVVAGSLARQMGNQAEACQRTDEAVAAWRALGDPDRLAEALARAAEVQGRLGARDRAKVLVEECLTLSDDIRRQGDCDHPIVCVEALAAWAAGDLDSARLLFDRSLALGRADGDVHTIQFALRYLGLLARQRGDVEQARAQYREALTLAREFGDHSCMLYELAGLAYLAADVENADGAARLLAAVSRLHEVMGVTLATTSGAGGFEDSVAAVRAVLGATGFDAAWCQGSAMSLDEAVDYALEEPASTR
ncbi:MAG: adenylate/guanylate cyclase domain-containing protein [Chloroflexota bacterium]